MDEDDSRWLDGLGARVLLEVGLRQGDRVLDFGCGTGFYVLPAAMVVAPDGVVYALDRDHGKLASLEEQIAVWRLSNIEVIETAGGVSLPFDDGSLDVVLIYDVLHSDFFSDEKRQRLLREAWRVLTRNGFLSVYPRHMEDTAATAAAEQAGFTIDRRVDTEVHHNHDLVHDMILNFKKIE